MFHNQCLVRPQRAFLPDEVPRIYAQFYSEFENEAPDANCERECLQSSPRVPSLDLLPGCETEIASLQGPRS